VNARAPASSLWDIAQAADRITYRVHRWAQFRGLSGRPMLAPRSSSNLTILGEGRRGSETKRVYATLAASRYSRSRRIMPFAINAQATS